MGRKCNVLHCYSDSRRIEDQGVTFHKMPTHSDLRPKWLSLCRIPEERRNVKVIYVCSRHFLRADFCNFKGTKYMLRQGALPSVFPWTTNPPKCIEQNVIELKQSIDAKDESFEIKSEIKSDPEDENDDESSEDDKKLDISNIVTAESNNTSLQMNEDNFKIKEEMFANKETNKSDTSTNTMAQNNTDESTNIINFTPGTRIEANDFHDKWYSAKIVEVDYDENEVFIHFEKCPNRGNEWIPMDSSRLRPFRPHRKNTVGYAVGERCLATWSDTRKFPATIKRIIDTDSYEVLFDDGYIKILKQNKLSKFNQNNIPEFKKLPLPHAAPLFDPVVGSKQERRDRKRKLNVAELFSKKRHRYDDPVVKAESSQEEEKIPTEDFVPAPVAGSSTQSEGEEWTCRWVNGEPIGQEALIDCMDGQRPSVIVPDHRLPPGWVKHLSKRMYGNSAGKWDTILLNPEGRKFRNKHEIKIYLEEAKLDYNIDQFDFGLHINRARKLGLYEVTDPEALAAAAPRPVPRHEAIRKSKELAKRSRISTPKHSGSCGTQPVTPETQDAEEDTEEEETTGGYLKIILENDSYKCPIEGCGKNFRKENLAQMHIKHYHPEYTKLLGSTPNVADLAYARTVGENIDDIVPKARPLPAIVEKPLKIETTPKPKTTIKVLTPKVPPKLDDFDSSKKPIEKNPTAALSTNNLPKPATKDAEIIRLLNSDPKSKGIDSIFEPSPPKLDLFQKIEPAETSKNNTESPKYPDTKLKDLLYKPDPVVIKKEETPTRPTGIKTLLPVIRIQEEPKVDPPPPSEMVVDSHGKSHLNVKYAEKSRPNRKRRTSDNDSVKKRRQSLKYDTDEYSDFYEADSISQDSFVAKKTPAESTPVPAETPQVIIEGGEVIRLVHMRREEIINCTCGITEEDGLMIQCELCLCWQHAHCNNIAKESQVPEKYICYICQNPHRMRASTKYMHDQDWLKQGTLATANYHSKDEELLAKRFENLRKSHELTGSLLELNDFIHNLRVKLNIAENKDHPKLYLWAKPWDKTVPDLSLNINKKEEEVKVDIKQETSSSCSNSDHSYIKGSSTFGDVALQSMLVPALDEIKIKPEDMKAPLISEDMKIKSQSELISILEEGNEAKPDDDIKLDLPKIDLNTMIPNNFETKSEDKEDKESPMNSLNSITGGLLSSGSLDLQLTQSDLERLSSLAQLTVETNPPQPNVPQPEAAIDSSDCRMNLLEHIEYFQNLVDEKLNNIEAEIAALESEETTPVPDETPEDYPRTKQTLQMLVRDLSTMRQIAAISQ